VAASPIASLTLYAYRANSWKGSSVAVERIDRQSRNQDRAIGVTQRDSGPTGCPPGPRKLQLEQPVARHQTPTQRETIERVMHEFKHGELKTAAGKRKVKNPKQAVAIALHEAGASKYESGDENKRNLRRTKDRERRGETYRDEAEGRKGRSRSAKSGSGNGKTRAELYEEAKKRNIQGRSTMNKEELERALRG
jgi:hypothetical protein